MAKLAKPCNEIFDFRSDFDVTWIEIIAVLRRYRTAMNSSGLRSPERILKAACAKFGAQKGASTHVVPTCASCLLRDGCKD